MGAIARVENNSFNNVLLAMVTNLDSDTEGSIQDIGNLLLGTSTTRITKTGTLTPPYSYRYVLIVSLSGFGFWILAMNELTIK